MEKKISNNLLSITGIFILLYGCYFNAIKTISLSFVVTLILALAFFVLNYILNKEKTININMGLFIFIIFSFFSLLYTKTPEQSIRVIITYFMFFLISMFLKYNEKIWDKTKMILLIFSGITLGITIISFISNDFYIDKILPAVYQGSQQAMYNLVVYAKSFPGIFASTGLNAFFLSIGYFIVLIDIFIRNKKNIWRYILLIIFVLGIFLTLKRIAWCLDFFITIFLIFITSEKKEKFVIKKKNIKYILIFIILGIVFCFSFKDTILNLTNRFFESEDLLNGRGQLYSFAYEKIYDNPFIGNGINSYSTLYGNVYDNALSTHNEFLQLTYELGILQTLVIGIFLLLNIFKTFKLCKKTKNHNELKNQYCFLILSIVIQIYFIIYCMTGNPFHDMNIYCIYMIFVTMTISLRKELESNEKEY